ncbi:hypothetical protein ACGFI9_13615 [Micromonospora sp. NPDC048930]|uniref:hypothetical protein n=1 Tax=Micromonospora sp. NPDC048930 TaxID=3364261 RepID=UPI0037227929
MSASPLTGLTHFVIPSQLLDETLDVLASAGRDGQEAFVVWGGVVRETTLEYRSLLVPEQTAYRTANGLLVTVDGPSLFAVNRKMYSRGELLAGQVHTHPTDAYHSHTDDHFPLVTLLGALSVVVPDFACDGRSGMAGWAWYRLAGVGRWRALGPTEHVEIVR